MEISAHTFSLADRPRAGPFGSPGFACAVKTGPPSRLILSQASAGMGIAVLRHRFAFLVQFLCSCQRGRSFAPARSSCKAPRAGAVKTGRLWRPPAGLGLDGSEHGATLIAGWDAVAHDFMHSNARSLLRTAHAMRASLLASAIASTLWCNLFLAASIQALSPYRFQSLILTSTTQAACTNKARK